MAKLIQTLDITYDGEYRYCVTTELVRRQGWLTAEQSMLWHACQYIDWHVMKCGEVDKYYIQTGFLDPPHPPPVQ